MILEIVLITLFNLLLFICLLSNNKDLSEFIFILIVLGIIILFGTLIGISDRYANDRITEIVSLDRNTGVYGHFSLGSGHVNSEPVYYAYTSTSDGGYKIIKIEDVVLYERNETPRLEIKTTCKEKNTWYNWNAKCKAKRSLIVPYNTIIKEFIG